jgi:hypothetical protein
VTQLALVDAAFRPRCAGTCGRPLRGVTWDAVDPRTGGLVEVCPACAHDYARKRQRREKRT